MAIAPDDFAIRYTWSTGALPHGRWGYGVTLAADGRGELTLSVDGGAPRVPAWRETFEVSGEQRDATFAMISAYGLFTVDWSEPGPPPTGGAPERLVITARGRVVDVPAASGGLASLIRETSRSVVPRAAWDRMIAERDVWLRREAEELRERFRARPRGDEPSGPTVRARRAALLIGGALRGIGRGLRSLF